MLNFSYSSKLHCFLKDAGHIINIFRFLSAQYWHKTKPASIVFPSPTSSASITPFDKGDLNATSMKVFYPENTEESPELSDYIVITLPDMDYKNYAKMMKKKHLKNGVDRFVQASVILPAITEAVGKLRMEETTESEDGNPISQFRGTVWADSIYAALKKYDIFDLSACAKSDYEIANILLGNVCSDSISNLMQKLSEWSTIREEDPTL